MKDDFFRRRLADLAAQSDRMCRFTFTDFLTEAEYSEFLAVRSMLPPCGFTAWGGRDDADRVMLRFGDPDQLGYEEPFPIDCVHIAPVMDKFADNLTHRDFLGALMHLGISRGELGDILVDEKSAYLLCKNTMSDYICREISRVRNTTVRCTVCAQLPALAAARTEIVTVQAASPRIDAVIAKVFHISRGDCLMLFRAGKVSLDGAVTERSSDLLRPGEKASVRGFGKFRYLGEDGKTRKGNLILRTEKFV